MKILDLLVPGSDVAVLQGKRNILPLKKEYFFSLQDPSAKLDSLVAGALSRRAEPILATAMEELLAQDFEERKAYANAKAKRSLFALTLSGFPLCSTSSTAQPHRPTLIALMDSVKPHCGLAPLCLLRLSTSPPRPTRTDQAEVC